MVDKTFHQSVGAVIEKDGKILLIDRKFFPLGWAGPAGHIDHGETPEEALKREVKEETNLEIGEYELLYHEFVPWNDCRSAKGHDWYLYLIKNWQGEIEIELEEAKDWQWVAKEELENLQLEPVWKYWFEKMGIMANNQ